MLPTNRHAGKTVHASHTKLIDVLSNGPLLKALFLSHWETSCFGFSTCSHALDNSISCLSLHYCGKSAPLTSRQEQLSFHLSSLFSSVLLSSVHVSSATIADRLPQYIPAVHHGKHSANHSEWLHHLATYAWHTRWCHEGTVTTGTVHFYPIPTS